jgi:DNA mismatch endonuclease (patch repair protein)
MTRPIPSSVAVSERMSRQARTGTSPEWLLRRELHRRGLRYRVNYAFLIHGLTRRRCDLAFTRRRVAVFVDGCFWHACPEHATSPKENAAWWRAKLEANAARDRDTDERLTRAGWQVVRVWEHESVASAADKVEAALQAPAR